jgi:Fe-S cluster assembly ATPase SufC
MDTVSFNSGAGAGGIDCGSAEELLRAPPARRPLAAAKAAPVSQAASMWDYYVTFRFSGAGAAERREQLLQLLRANADELSWWDETGAFVLFQSGLDIAELRVLAEKVAVDDDFVLIGMVYIMRWELIGSAHDKSMFRVLRHTDGFG